MCDFLQIFSSVILLLKFHTCTDSNSSFSQIQCQCHLGVGFETSWCKGKLHVLTIQALAQSK